MEIEIDELRHRMDNCTKLQDILTNNNMLDFKPEITSHFTDRYTNSATRGFLKDSGCNIADSDTITIVACRYKPIVEQQLAF